MPTLYGQAAIDAFSETADVPYSAFRLIYGLNASIEAVSQADNILQGRNRVLKAYTGRSTAKCIPFGRVRRHVQSAVKGRAIALNRHLNVIPAIPAPQGQLFLEDKPLREQRLPRGTSQSFAFTIIGKRLKGLQVNFLLRSTRGLVLLQKTILIAPGGVAISEFLQDSDGIQTIGGFIILMPNETLFSTFKGREIEVNFVFQIGNGSSREHLLESNYINFYTA